MTYQAIILPRTLPLPSDLSKPGEWTSKMNGTGPFMLRQNRGAAGISFVANPNYWGGRPALDAVECRFLEDQARVTALQSGQIDLAVQISLPGRAAARSREHEGHPAADGEAPLPAHEHEEGAVQRRRACGRRSRSRSNRPQIAQGLWGKYAEVGNDSPMWPGYAFTDKSVPQRKQDLARAKALLKAAGKENLKRHAQLLPRLRDARLRAARGAGAQADRRQLHGQGVHGRAVLRRRQLRRRGQARAVARRRLRHRRLRRRPCRSRT